MTVTPGVLDASFTTVEEAVTDRLRRAILSGDLPPGMRMLQGELAERMAISITPIRAALRQLAAEGLIRIEPRRTVVVHTPTPDEIDEVFFLRTLLEPESAKRAAPAATPDQIAEAERLVALMGAEANVGQWGILNRDFHAVLIAASGASRLTTMVLNLLSISTVSIRNLGLLTPERMREANEQHRAILAAYRAHDPAAARDSTLLHLSSTKKFAVPTTQSPDPAADHRETPQTDTGGGMRI